MCSSDLRFPRQVLLYVGEAPLRMAKELRGDDVWFRYRAIDIRELDGERLLESEEVGDNVIAILARLRDDSGADRRSGGGGKGNRPGPVDDPGGIEALGENGGTGDTEHAD